MSNAASNWAWEVRDISPAMKLVLVSLADHVGEDHHCYPNQRRIAARCCMSRSAVNKNLAKLEEAGLIAIVQRNHEGSRAKRSCVYQLAAPLGDKTLKPSPEIPGHIYVVTSNFETKVGATKNIDLTIKTLNAQSSDGVTLIRVFDLPMSRARRIARIVCDRFADYRRSGEWLDIPEASAIEEIDRVISSNEHMSDEDNVDVAESDDVVSEMHDVMFDEHNDSGRETQGLSSSDHTDVSDRHNLNRNYPSPEPSVEPQKNRGTLFDEFWKSYPNKVGKGAARRCFEKVMKDKLVTFDVMMAALHQYANKTDDRAFCNPATWLNQERWDDQPARGTTGSLSSRIQSQKRAAI